MDNSKLKEIKDAFVENDTKLVKAFNEGTDTYGVGIERQLYFLQTRMLLVASVVNQFLDQLIEATNEEPTDGKIEEQTK
jgi:hypothetical protein